jgi:hypothetical protein
MPPPVLLIFPGLKSLEQHLARLKRQNRYLRILRRKITPRLKI